jgi:superfamily I DNA/RNA helicase
MSLLRRGKRARIAGRDIGKNLTIIVNKQKARSIDDLIEKLQAWAARETHKLALAKREKDIEAVNDKLETLITLTDGCDSLADLIDRIEALFTDDGLGADGIITCSSVHKAKGLEAKRVFVLWNTMRDGNQEEKNIQYVAITRAKQELVYVS